MLAKPFQQLIISTSNLVVGVKISDFFISIKFALDIVEINDFIFYEMQSNGTTKNYIEIKFTRVCKQYIIN